jgi:hypothetical protein
MGRRAGTSTLSLAPLLIHTDDVPADARAALRDAYNAPADEREPHLEAAALALYRDADLDCADARELVGLAVDV